MTEQRIFMKDIIWESFAGPIPDGFKVAHRNGNPRQNLHLVPADQYPGDDDQVFAPVAPRRPRRTRRSR